MSNQTDPATQPPQHAQAPPPGAPPVAFPTDPAFALSAIPQDQLLAILRNVPNLLQGKVSCVSLLSRAVRGGDVWGAAGMAGMEGRLCLR